MKQTILFLAINLITSICYPNDTIVNSINSYQTIESIKDDIKEIRRDQLNYKIEKDLLKETYSSNYSAIQIIISLILGVFAVLSYLGFKGILGLKNEYDSELIRIREMKSDFEVKLKELNESQEKLKVQISTIDTLNEEQNNKIKLLEIKEKANSWFNQKGYQRALEYITIGLELGKNDIELLTTKAYTLLKLNNYAEAIEAHKKVLSLDSTNSSIILNLAELYLLTNQVDSYKTLVADKLEFIKSQSEGLIFYFEAFKNYIDNKPVELKKTISDFLDKQDINIMKNYLGTWGLDEFRIILNSKQLTPEKTLLFTFTEFLRGAITGLPLKELLK